MVALNAWFSPPLALTDAGCAMDSRARFPPRWISNCRAPGRAAKRQQFAGGEIAIHREIARCRERSRSFAEPAKSSLQTSLQPGGAGGTAAAAVIAITNVLTAARMGITASGSVRSRLRNALTAAKRVVLSCLPCVGPRHRWHPHQVIGAQYLQRVARPRGATTSATVGGLLRESLVVRPCACRAHDNHRRRVRFDV